MNRLTPFIVAAGLCLSAASSYAALPTVTPTKNSPHATLDAKLSRSHLHNVGKSEVTNAVAGIFQLTGLDADGASVAGLTGKIVNAELAFQANQHAASHERDVAIALNRLAKKFGLPASALTNPNEVRKLHVSLVSVFPGYLTNDLQSRLKADSGPHLVVRTEMSPLETTLLFCVMLHQKLSNPAYQLTNAEYRQAFILRHQGKPTLTPEDRSNSISGAFHQGVSKGKLSDLDSVLADLGIAGGTK